MLKMKINNIETCLKLNICNFMVKYSIKMVLETNYAD